MAPFFIVGPSRSGSTLLARMLDAHPELAVLPESWMFVTLDRLGCVTEFRNKWQYILFMNEVYRALSEYEDPAATVIAAAAAKQPAYVGPTRPILENLGEAYMRARSANHWGEKTPSHALRLPEIHAVFPEAKLICIVRDPRDILVSYADRWNGGKPETLFLMRSAALVRYYLHHLVSNRAFPPENVHWVTYESLVTNTEATLQGICHFLAIDYDSSMMEYHTHHYLYSNSRLIEFHRLLDKPPTRSRIGRYREALTSDQLIMIESFLRHEMNILGYEVRQASPPSTLKTMDTVLAHAEEQYQRMKRGEVRRRHRMRGWIKVLAYRALGRSLLRIPRFRVVVDPREWRERARHLFP